MPAKRGRVEEKGNKYSSHARNRIVIAVRWRALFDASVQFCLEM
jgi:hypothetical protein